MITHQTIFRRRYTCGQHVKGIGKQLSSAGKPHVFEKGVITALPSKSGEPYTVLDETTFKVLEAQEEHLTPLS